MRKTGWMCLLEGNNGTEAVLDVHYLHEPPTGHSPQPPNATESKVRPRNCGMEASSFKSLDTSLTHPSSVLMWLIHHTDAPSLEPPHVVGSQNTDMCLDMFLESPGAETKGSLEIIRPKSNISPHPATNKAGKRSGRSRWSRHHSNKHNNNPKFTTSQNNLNLEKSNGESSGMFTSSGWWMMDNDDTSACSSSCT